MDFQIKLDVAVRGDWCEQMGLREPWLIEQSPLLNDAVAGLVIGKISSEYKWEEVPRMSGNTDFISYR